MDNKQIVGSPDKDRINIHEAYEVDYWSNKFGVTPEKLKDAISKVGSQVKDVEEALKR